MGGRRRAGRLAGRWRAAAARPDRGHAPPARDAHRVLHGALHDPVTGLPEQALLLDRLEQAMARARRLDRGIALLVVRVAGLPAVAACHGRAGADRLLREVGRRLSATLRESDTAARYAEADFVVLCDGLRTDDDLALVAERLAAALEPRYDVRSGTVAVPATLHLVLPEPTSTPLTLLDETDALLRRDPGPGDPAR